tara:strand:- start:2193 stop:2573 length:381 start_codon:yes stop_codon:yes gene_type:complete
MASNPLLKFRNEILEKVVYPKVYGILFDKGNNITPTQLWKEFREKHECSVSLKEFKEWLNVMGLNQEQVTTWNIDVPVHAHDGLAKDPDQIPGQHQAYQDSFFNEPINKVPEVKVPDDPDISFDNE